MASDRKDDLMQFTKDQIIKLRDLEGKTLSYAQLCDSAQIKKLAGDSKKKQLKDLEAYCDFEKIDGADRYSIIKVYDEAASTLVQSKITGVPKQQLLFDAVLYSALLPYPKEALYVSNLELLQLFGEVNDNFKYCVNIDRLKEVSDGEDILYMNDMSKTVYHILSRWTKRRIQNMNERHVIMHRYGFRLYTIIKSKDDDIEYKIAKNVPIGSNLEKRCQAVWGRALRSVEGEDFLMSDGSLSWMPEEKWHLFEINLRNMVRAEFDAEDYSDMRVVNVIWGAEESFLREEIKRLYQRIVALDNIQERAQSKVRKTKQLDKEFEKQDREEFIDYNMTDEPPRWFDKKKGKKWS